jgi:hypothetical protein
MKITFRWCIYYKAPLKIAGLLSGRPEIRRRKEQFMDSNDKLLMDLAVQLGLGKPESSASKSESSVSKQDRMSEIADKYKGKSDQELISEIMKVKQSLKKDKAQYEKQMKTIKALRSMMTGEQRARLEKLIRLLEADD